MLINVFKPLLKTTSYEKGKVYELITNVKKMFRENNQGAMRKN